MVEDEIDDYTLDAFLEDRQKIGMQPFTLEGMTTAQEAAIREVAQKQGFKDLRGYHMYMKSMDLDYYDIIKMKYEE